MSRVCVKNVADHITEKALREHFSSQGAVVTDVKVLRTKSGKHRHMAFVGFRNAGDGPAVVKYFNKAYLGSSRLMVESARPVDFSSLKGGLRPKGKAAHDAMMKSGKKGGAGASVHDGSASNDQKEEFMVVMQSRRKTALWADDDDNDERSGKAARSAAKGKGKGKGKGKDRADSSSDGSDGDTDSDEYDSGERGGRKMGGGSDSASDSDSDSDREGVRSARRRGSGKGKQGSAAASGAPSSSDSSGSESDSDSDRARKKRKQKSKSEKGSKEEGKGRKDAHGEDDGEDSDPDVGETGRLFIRNLPYSVTDEELAALFGRYGTVSDAHVIVDEAKQSKGIGYVEFMIPENAVAALGGLDGSCFQGRLIHVLPAKPHPSSATGDGGEDAQGAKRGYKAELEAKKRKAAAEGAEESIWNPLFVRGDTAVKALSNQFGVSEGEILDPTAEGVAVRMALGETHVVKQTKEFLEKEGVSIAAVETALRGVKVKRSKTTILVKNLPFSVSESALRDLFGRYGALARVVLPPAKAIAVVEFTEPKHAKRAFRSLAYSRFERAPLYLEWAPLDVFTRGPVTTGASAPSDVTAKADVVADSGASAPVAAVGEGHSGEGGDDEGESMIEQTNTVYVKNLNFESTEEGLRDMFSVAGDVRAAMIPRKSKTGKDGKKILLSMGYGFVEFKTREDAMNAIKRLQNATLDGHALQLKLSAKQLKPDAAATSKRKTTATSGGSKATKLLVKNLAFEAVKKDLQELFGAFGQLKSVRIPRKFDGNHRGFGFVDFLTHQEAVNAMEALSSSHLYGRHLVIEWAKEEEGVEELRKKSREALAPKSKSNKRKRALDA